MRIREAEVICRRFWRDVSNDAYGSGMEPRKVLKVLVDTVKKTFDADVDVVEKVSRLVVVVQCKDLRIRFLEMTGIIRFTEDGPKWEAEMKFPRVVRSRPQNHST